MSSPFEIHPLSHLEQARLTVKCSFCTRIIKHFYVQCATCSGVFLCADCFSAQVIMPPHDSSHPYYVARCLERNIFEKDWSAKEELMLLDGIQKYGAGNWKEIAAFMDSDKKEKKIDEHYWQLFMGKHGVCLPLDYSIDNLASLQETVALFPDEPDKDETTSEEIIPSSDYFRIPLVPGYTRGEEVERDVLPNHPMTLQTSQTPSKGGRASQQAQQALLQPDLPGYMPLREDFETEYENDAEQFLADMEFSPEDHPSEVELKLQVIRIYNHKLTEREKRKKFVLEHGLVDIKKHQQEEKKLSKEERELVAKLRPFARYHSHEEHDALVKGILKAHKLRQQIEMYKIYRKLGLSTLDDVTKYETEKKQKEQEQRYRKERDSAAYLYEKSHLQTGVSALGKRGSSSLDLAEEAAATAAPSGRGRGRPGRHKATTASSDSVAATTTPSSDINKNNNNNNHNHSMAVDDDPQLPPTEDMATDANAADTTVNRWSVLPPLVSLEDVRHATGGHLLADLEVQLCARIPMQPLLYLAVKEAMVREAAASGVLTATGVKRRMGVSLSQTQTDALYDFFVTEAHINEALARHLHHHSSSAVAALTTSSTTSH